MSLLATPLKTFRWTFTFFVILRVSSSLLLDFNWQFDAFLQTLVWNTWHISFLIVLLYVLSPFIVYNIVLLSGYYNVIRGCHFYIQMLFAGGKVRIHKNSWRSWMRAYSLSYWKNKKIKTNKNFWKCIFTPYFVVIENPRWLRKVALKNNK